MRGMIAVVAVLICCMADPLAPWSNLQTVNPPVQGQDLTKAPYDHRMPK